MNKQTEIDDIYVIYMALILAAEWKNNILFYLISPVRGYLVLYAKFR